MVNPEQLEILVNGQSSAKMRFLNYCEKFQKSSLSLSPMTMNNPVFTGQSGFLRQEVVCQIFKHWAVFFLMIIAMLTSWD